MKYCFRSSYLVLLVMVCYVQILLYLVESRFRKEISDSLAVAQRPRLTGKESCLNTNERVVLFVKMCPDLEFNKQLEDKIKKTIRQLISPRHVPEVVLETEDIPVRISRFDF